MLRRVGPPAAHPFPTLAGCLPGRLGPATAISEPKGVPCGRKPLKEFRLRSDVAFSRFATLRLRCCALCAYLDVGVVKFGRVWDLPKFDRVRL